MSDLFKTLFEDLPEPDDDLMRLLEAAERVEKMEVHKKPLEDALKELHIEGELFATPDGMKIVFADDAAFHLAAKLLGLPEVITQLAGQGWVPVCGGDVRPSDETSEYTWKFLEVDDMPLNSNDDAPSSEEIATAAMKFNGFAAQDHKAVNPPMQGDARGVVKKSQQNKAVKESQIDEGAVERLAKEMVDGCSLNRIMNYISDADVWSISGVKAPSKEDADAYNEAYNNALPAVRKAIKAAAAKLLLSEDTVSDIMAWEAGEMDEEQEVAFFQKLIDTGMVWGLQGMYGRRAQDLLDAGLCHPPKDRLRGQPRNRPRPELPGD